MNHLHHTLFTGTEITTRHEWESNVPTTYIRLGDDEITVIGHPRCSRFAVSHRKQYERCGLDITDDELWQAGATHGEVVNVMARYLETRPLQLTVVYQPCPACNGRGDVIGILSA